MPEIINQAVESFAQVPDGLERPLQTAAVLGGTAVAIVAQGVRYHLASEKQAAPFSNPALLEASIKPSRAIARRSRMWPAYSELLGGGLMLTSWLGGLNYDTATPNHDANVVVVQDESFSMLNTADLDSATTTRAQATADALKSIDFQANLGVVQFGADNQITHPLSKWASPTSLDLSKPAIDPNGGKLVQTMDLAASLFPVAEGKTSAHNTEVVITDGTIDDSSDAIKTETAKLQQKGIDVKIVVPGTVKGTYTLPGTTEPVASGADMGKFSKLPSQDVIAAKTVSEVMAAIHKDVHASGITHNKHKWLVPGALGFLLASAGFLTNQVQRSRRVV